MLYAEVGARASAQMMWRSILPLFLFGAMPLAAQPADPPIQTPIEALAMDAAQYARQHDVALGIAMARLEAQEQSVPAVERLADTYRDRLAGISVEHDPGYRIVFLLTGPDPVPTQTISAGGLTVPIEFRTGAQATREQIRGAISAHQAEIRAMLRRPPGLGLDPRTGDLVVIIGGGEAAAADPAALRDRLHVLTGVPISLRLFAHADANLAEVVGGGRLIGPDAQTGVRSRCTTGFVVTDGTRTGIATAAHCPDQAVYRAPDGTDLPLEFVGQWGARYQDVQIHLTPAATRPLFHPDTARQLLRPVTGWRNRAATRAGDFVCHRGERTGYSCAEVALVDYAPPGDLCGGPCTPDWVTVAGPTCNHGDSGGPVFSGTIAFGLVKGGSYRSDGSCSFYFYMSTDYLPPPWRLLYQPAQPMPPPER